MKTYEPVVQSPHANKSALHVSELVSYEMRQICTIINFVVICGVLSLFGIGANIVNIVVFIKQGLKESVNISFLGLAVADLMCVITSLWSSIWFNPLFARAGVPFRADDMVYLSSGYSHECFSRTTSCISAFITLERCLCIATPLKVKTIITPRRTKIIIIGIFVVMIVIFSPFYAVNLLTWQFDATFNRTILKISYTDDREIVETIIFGIHSVVFSSAALITVIVCTIILIFKLIQKSRWRQSTVTKGSSNQEMISMKEKKVMKMVTFISVIFIICFVPPTGCFFMMAYDTKFSFTGEHENLVYVVISFSYVLETVNSVSNIFVYFNMSSKYRLTFYQVFCNSKSMARHINDEY